MVASRRPASVLASAGAAAAVTQAWQAAGSFVVQVSAAHVLGAAGLGTLALCLGVIIVSTAVTSGVVGDSLTVLDRHDRGIRAGLEWWTVLLVTTTSVLSAAALGATGLLNTGEALLFLAASMAFQVEEIVRRVHMARLDFWRLLPVDSVALGVTITGLVLVAVTGSVTLGTFLASLAVGQVAGCVTAAALLPPQERRIVRPVSGSRAVVWRFGLWRGLQVSVNPAVLTVTRLVVVAAAGAASLGLLEAARILVAPVLLLAQGFGAYLFASYARDRELPLEALVRRASRVSLRLGLAVLATGALLTLASPLLSVVAMGPDFQVERVSLIGWAAYGAAVAWLQPIASLAAVRGRPGSVLVTRAAGSVASLAALALLVLALSVPVALTPFVLAAGAVVGRLLTVQFVLRPMVSGRKSPDQLGPDDPEPASDQRHAHGASPGADLQAASRVT